MAFDCSLKILFHDLFPKEYYKFITNEKIKGDGLSTKNAPVGQDRMLGCRSTTRPSILTNLIEKSKRNGLKHSIFNAQKDVYVGEWRNDKKHGLGVFRTKSGKYQYIGEWADGLPDGYGQLCRRDHDVYKIVQEGYWKCGKPQGKHVKVYPDGSCYEGDLEQGAREGQGKMWFADGTYYEGDYSQNKRHGQGLFVFQNGNCYNGSWRKNEKHGFGVYHYLTRKQAQIGHWAGDKCTGSWIVDTKYRQSAQRPTEYPIPIKDPPVKQFKRHVVTRDKETEKKDAATQTDDEK
ncbi:MORN [Nesidiocoris tenuis]|uniref:MORN repeat-containing protein 3 n=1 Tax=Nesidiocoris tenuis TaxID=355587 RepID=A0ABN7ATN1_9HEMI|nr:MORN [Nesidiocoris tenuis]